MDCYCRDAVLGGVTWQRTHHDPDRKPRPGWSASPPALSGSAGRSRRRWARRSARSAPAQSQSIGPRRHFNVPLISRTYAVRSVSFLWPHLDGPQKLRGTDGVGVEAVGPMGVIQRDHRPGRHGASSHQAAHLTNRTIQWVLYPETLMVWVTWGPLPSSPSGVVLLYPDLPSTAGACDSRRAEASPPLASPQAWEPGA